MKTSDKIKKIIKDNGYNYKVRIFPKVEKYFKNGEEFIEEYEKIIIYAGKNIEKIAQRRSRKLIAWKNERKEWEGDLEKVKEYGADGNLLYLLDYNNNKKEAIKTVLFSDIWEEKEKDGMYPEKKLLKILEDWKCYER